MKYVYNQNKIELGVLITFISDLSLKLKQILLKLFVFNVLKTCVSIKEMLHDLDNLAKSRNNEKDLDFVHN